MCTADSSGSNSSKPRGRPASMCRKCSAVGTMETMTEPVGFGRRLDIGSRGIGHMSKLVDARWRDRSLGEFALSEQRVRCPVGYVNECW